MDRKPLSKSLRFSVFERDGFACRYCGEEAPYVVLVVDHKIAVANGGTNDFENLITACESCNQGKSARELNNWPDDRMHQDIALAQDHYDCMEAIARLLRALRTMPTDEAALDQAIGFANRVLDENATTWIKSGRAFIEELAAVNIGQD